MTQAATPRLTGSVEHMIFVRAGDRIIAAASRSQGIELLRSDETAMVIHSPVATHSLARVPTESGEILLAGGADGVIRAYDPLSGAYLSERPIGNSPLRDLAVLRFEPNRYIVASVRDGGIALLPWAPGSEITELPGSGGPASSRAFKICAYSAHNKHWLACASTDGTVSVWNVDDPAEPTTQRAHDGPIWSMITLLDPAGDPVIVTGGSDRAMRIWKPSPEGTLVASRSFTADGTIRRLGHLRDGNVPLLATASASGLVSLWRFDGPPDRPLMEVTRHAGEAWALACANTEDGVVIASGDMNGDIQITPLSTDVLKDVWITFHSDTTVWAVTSGVISNSPYVACAGVDQTVHVIDGFTRNELFQLRGHTSTVRALTATGAHLISGGADGRVLDWDPGTGTLRREIPMGHSGEVWALGTLHSGGVDFAVSAGAGGSVRVCPLADSGEVRVIGEGFGEINALTTVRAGDDWLIVIGSTRGLLTVSFRDPSQTWTIVNQPVGAVCTIDDNGRQLVMSARQDGLTQLIDPVLRTVVTTFTVPHPGGGVRALASTKVKDNTLIFGGCDDGRLLVWHIDGSLVGEPARGGTAAIRSMSTVELDRPALITAGHDGDVRIWPIAAGTPLRSGGSIGQNIQPVSILLQDQPTNTDTLSRAALIEAILGVLISPETVPPVVVGVHAPWGQGKSSVLRQLRHHLDPTSDAPTHELVSTRAEKLSRFRRRWEGGPVRTRLTRSWAWRQIQRRDEGEAQLTYEMRPKDGAGGKDFTIWFNPWMYERPDQIWAGLTREILSSITDRLPQPQRERLWFDLNLRRTDPAAMRRRIMTSYIPRTLKGLFASVVVLAVGAIAVIAMGVAAVNNEKVAAILGSSVLIVIGALGIVAQLAATTFKRVRGWMAPAALSGPAAGGITTSQHERDWKGGGDPLEATNRGYLYLLQHDVREVVDLATKHSRVFIFVDDLDRCGPAIVADTIEAINLFLSKAFGPCMFVIALDPATVAAHLETAYDSIDQRAKDDPTSFGHLRHTGWRFMEKIVDLPIRLPRVSDEAIQNYLNQLLDSSSAESGKPAAPTVTAPPVLPRQRRGWTRQLRSSGRTQTTTQTGPDLDTTSTTMLDGVQLADKLEALAPVRNALRAAVHALPRRNPRQTKTFINLWRFYMLLEFRTGHLSTSPAALEQHSIEVARFVEMVVRWPRLLDLLVAESTDGVAGRSVLAELLDASGDDRLWAEVAKATRLNPEEAAAKSLRELLRRPGSNAIAFAAIASRYL